MYNRASPGMLPSLLQPPAQKVSAPILPPPDPFWQRSKLQAHLASLLQNVAILKSIGDELEAIQSIEVQSSGTDHGQSVARTTPKDGNNDAVSTSSSASKVTLLKLVEESVSYWPESASLATQAAIHLLGAVKAQLDPLKGVLNGNAGTEKMLAAKQLGSRRKKLKRNRKWRSQKRRGVAEVLRKERERFETLDREADEWMAREIAKGIAKQKIENMKELAEKTSKLEKARRQQQVEMGLLVEKLQELRALRILKLKKQGRFFPEEDDQFMERVRAAVEEEERQAAAAANTSAATTAIMNAEEARKAALVAGRVSDHKERVEMELEVPTVSKESLEPAPEECVSGADLEKSKPAVSTSLENGADLSIGYEGLPPEFHHYFFGSSFGMGTLIEVRQAWDTFIMPGGSRIPQHWIEAPPPANPVWASYLVKQPKVRKRRREATPNETR